jgi:putative tryptophan/tyrosine transport system substrate-binding protein
MRRREFISFVGGAAALPFATSAAMGKVPTLGYLSDEGAGPHPFRSHRPVLDGLRQLGYVEGQNILVEYRNANGEVGKLPSFAAELAALPVDVIFAVGTPAVRAAIAATKTVPIVFSRVGDPVAAGLVASLARPDGNATGVTVFTTDLAGRRLQVLKELVPELTTLAILHEPKFLPGQLELKALTPIAQSINLQLHLVGTETIEALEDAAGPLGKGSPQALFVGSSGWFEDHYQLAIDAASKAHLPALYVRREYPAAGGLVSYGIPYREMYRTAAGYIDRVLKGANPRDLPVQNPVKTELVINLKTAKTLGLTVPDKLLAITDEVIES